MNPTVIPTFSIEQFEAGEIDPDEFNHEAHVYVAWLYVQRYELSAAIHNFVAALQQLITGFGAEDKYHSTLTWFFLLLVAERTEADEPWPAFRSRNLDIVCDSKKILARYYTSDYLFSDRARQRFVLPNNLSYAAKSTAKKDLRSVRPC